MNKYLIIYASEIDFEGIESIEGYDLLQEQFDCVKSISGHEDEGKRLHTCFLREIEQIQKLSQDVYLQIISHGNEEGIAIRSVKDGQRIGSRDTLVAYSDLASQLPNSLKLNLMTICKSDSLTSHSTDFKFLAVSIMNSFDTEAIAHSRKVLEEGFENDEVLKEMYELGYRFFRNNEEVIS